MEDLENFTHELRAAIDNSKSIIFAANCYVEYSGRAESLLHWGDRIIIIKPDNTLLVHQPTGTTPVNYMKGNVTHSVSYNKGSVILQSQNMKQKEYMSTKIRELYFFNDYDLQDGQSIQLVGSEKDMVQHIIENPHLISKDFKPVSTEEQTKFGFIDIMGHDKNGTLIIVECKRYQGDYNAVSQLHRYVKRIKKTKGTEKVKGILACPKLSPGVKEVLEKYDYSFIKINPPNYLRKFNEKQTRLT